MNYLVPVDADMKSDDEADILNVRVDDILAVLEKPGAKLNIVVLDACRNNPFPRLRATSGGLAPVKAPRGTYVAYATAPGEVAADGGAQPNSPFTWALAETIREPGLRLEEVFKKTREKVLASTGNRQIPWDTSSITGNFFFKENNIETIAPVQQLSVCALEWPIVERSNSERALVAYSEKCRSDRVFWNLAQEKIQTLAPKPEAGAATDNAERVDAAGEAEGTSSVSKKFHKTNTFNLKTLDTAKNSKPKSIKPLARSKDPTRKPSLRPKPDDGKPKLATRKNTTNNKKISITSKKSGIKTGTSPDKRRERRRLIPFVQVAQHIVGD